MLQDLLGKNAQSNIMRMANVPAAEISIHFQDLFLDSMSRNNSVNVVDAIQDENVREEVVNTMKKSYPNYSEIDLFKQFDANFPELNSRESTFELNHLNLYDLQQAKQQTSQQSTPTGKQTQQNEEKRRLSEKTKSDFEQACIYQISQALEQHFTSIRDAMIAVRKANYENRKLEIDWISLGRQFNWDKRKTNNSFYILQSAVLDKWPKETIKKV